MRPLVDELLALGVVAVARPGRPRPSSTTSRGPIEAYRALAAAGELGLRVAPVRPARAARRRASAEGIRSGQPLGPDPLDRLRLGWLKTFADGSLGSRTAALLEPLERGAGEPEPPNGGYGVWLTPPEELRAQATRAAALGIATQIHGIGDAAVRAALDVLGADRRRDAARAPRRAHAARPPRRRARGSPRWGSRRRSSRSTSAATRRRRAGCGATARTAWAYALGAIAGPGR